MTSGPFQNVCPVKVDNIPKPPSVDFHGKSWLYCLEDRSLALSSLWGRVREEGGEAGCVYRTPSRKAGSHAGRNKVSNSTDSMGWPWRVLGKHVWEGSALNSRVYLFL